VGKRPKVLISDGAGNFAIASRKEWYSYYPEKCTTHAHALPSLEGINLINEPTLDGGHPEPLS
jgi:hypothetical protein